jgi:hypothetical protein
MPAVCGALRRGTTHLLIDFGVLTYTIREGSMDILGVGGLVVGVIGLLVALGALLVAVYGIRDVRKLVRELLTMERNRA